MNAAVLAPWSWLSSPPQHLAGYRAAGVWRDRTVADLTRVLADAEPDTPVFLGGEPAPTYGSLMADAEALCAAMIGLGLKAGEVVSLQTPNWAEACVINLAAALGGLRHQSDRHHLSRLGSADDARRLPGEALVHRRAVQRLRLLAQHLDVAVVAMPHPRLGEGVCAFVATRDGRRIEPAALIATVAASGLAKQKTLERFIFVEALPRTASGKVRKDVLRAQAKAEVEAAR